MSGAHSSPSDGGDRARTTPPCDIAVHRADAEIVVTMRGELHANTVEGLDHILRDLICDQGNVHVVVDVGAVLNADTTGVAALVDACRLAREHHATVALVNLTPAIERALGRWRHEGIVTEHGVGGFGSSSNPATSDRPPRAGEGQGGFDERGLPASATGPPEASCRGLADHVVEFYFREAHLAESVRKFLLPALDRGQAALVVATDDHRRRCDEELRAAGIDIDSCRRKGQYMSLDAGETLAKFMVGDVPNGPQFETVVGDLVRRMAASCGGIRIFGEMVTVLWADGNVGAAVALEDLWNSLQAQETVELLCAYPTSLFERDDATEPFRRICDRHTRVVPSERIAVEHGALRAIALLEQRVDAASAARCALERHSRMVVEAQEGERRRVAGELHDEIGQMLTGLKLALEGHDRLSSEAAAVRLAQARELTVELLRRVHDLSLDLRPTILDDLGLQPALVWLAQRYGDQTGVQVTLRCSGLEGRLRPEVETAAYRIVQEALTNVARHAGVARAGARCALESGRLRLEVADDGTGFEMEAVPAGKNSGLAGMEERARSIGGRIRVHSTPGRGTTVVAELPLN